MKQRQIKHNSGFTHTPILALLLSVFGICNHINMFYKDNLFTRHFSQKQKNTKLKLVSGFSLVEILIYIFLITLLTVALINALVFMTKSYREVRAEKSIIVSASTLLNRFSYEVKRSNDVSGSFGVSTSSLTLTSGTTTTILSLDSNSKRVSISINGVTDYLTSAEVEVSSLEFDKLLATSTSKGVLMQFSITSKTSTPKTENFETSALIRNLTI